MRVVFAHDHFFVQTGSVVLSDTFSYLVWRRYLSHFEGLTVYARRSDPDSNVGQMQVSSGPGVSFVFGSNLSTPRAWFGARKREAARIEDVIREHDAVIARVPSELGLLAIDVAQKLQKPYLIEVVGCAWDALWNYGRLHAKAYAPIMLSRIRRAVRKAQFVCYVSQSFLQRRYPASGRAVVAAISNVEIEEPGNEVLEARMRRIDQGRENTVFGLIGSFKTRYKGLHTAIEALSSIQGRVGGFQLRVLGNGDLRFYQRMAAKHGIADRVFFDGRRSGARAVFDWLDGIDVYLQPSLQEGVPRALIEAMSRGCPAIASTAGGIPELLDPESTFRPGQAAGLASLILRAVGNDQWMRAQAVRNFETAKRYAKPILDQRRAKFLDQFVARILDASSQRRASG